MAKIGFKIKFSEIFLHVESLKSVNLMKNYFAEHIQGSQERNIPHFSLEWLLSKNGTMFIFLQEHVGEM